jgi:5'-deoxynucleotidase YfbR-like HD superfamily hydrolase
MRMPERPTPLQNEPQGRDVTDELLNEYGRDFKHYLDSFSEDAVLKHVQWMDDLSQIDRFSAPSNMIHRGEDLTHVLRTEVRAQWLMSTYIPRELRPNVYRLHRLSRNHDNAEKETGDVPTQDKQRFSEAERKAFEATEDEAAPILAQRYAPEGYQDLYVADHFEIRAKSSRAAQLVDIADKWDALGQVLHDIRCGNDSDEAFQILQRYRDTFQKLSQYQMFKFMNEYNADFALRNFPTDNDAREMSRLNLNDLRQGKDTFWQKVFDPSAPEIYHAWLTSAPTSIYYLNIFPTWKKELMPHRLSFEELIKYL